MNKLTLNFTKIDGIDTMSSLELAKLCIGKDKYDHKNFVAKMKKVLGESAVVNFYHRETYGNNNTRTVYNLPEREACLMAMSYSYELQAKVYDAWRKEKEETQALPTTIKEVALLLLQSEEEKELLLEQNKTIVKVSTKKSLQTYTPTKLLAFLYKEGIVSPTDGLAVSDINVALTFAGYQTKQTSPRNGSYVHSYSLTDKGVEFAVQQVSGMTTSCKWLYTITKQQDFIDVINSIVAGEFY